MTTTRERFRQAGQALAIAVLMVSMNARAAAINTGVEQLLWPVVIVASPFLTVHDLLFGSDTSAMRSAESEANKILDAHKDQIPVSGLYTGSLNLRAALYGMLVESRLPFIEINTAGSVWLLSLAKTPQPLISQAEQHKYIRLSLGKLGNPACFAWQSTLEDWTTSPPVRPGTCLMIEFENNLQSDVELRVDTSKASSRKLRWELVDRPSGNVRLSVPFWESQIKGQPLRVTAVYRSADENYAFIRTLRKLSPMVVPKDADGRPYVMSRIGRPDRREFNVVPTDVQGEFRVPVLDWQAIQKPKENEHWSEGYERAYATGKPVIVNNALLIVPQDDKVGRPCANPAGNDCDFANSSISDLGVLSMRYAAAYENPYESRKPGTRPLAHGMAVRVAARKFDGNLLWYASIKPASLPESHQICKDFSIGCYFYPKRATTTANELVVLGVFGANGSAERHLPRDEYELVVPLAALPSR